MPSWLTSSQIGPPTLTGRTKPPPNVRSEAPGGRILGCRQRTVRVDRTIVALLLLGPDHPGRRNRRSLVATTQHFGFGHVQTLRHTQRRLNTIRPWRQILEQERPSALVSRRDRIVESSRYGVPSAFNNATTTPSIGGSPRSMIPSPLRSSQIGPPTLTGRTQPEPNVRSELTRRQQRRLSVLAVRVSVRIRSLERLLSARTQGSGHARFCTGPAANPRTGIGRQARSTP